MIKNDTYDRGMAKLGSYTATATATVAPPVDLGSLVASISHHPLAGRLAVTPVALLAALEAWTHQDDDAHDMCSLVACRTPLHPGPCKGWKHTLHSVSPHIWHQMEQERVRKANERRLKRIAELKSQGKPIPRRLLTEIQPKPAPGQNPANHPATNVTPTPLGQVGQKADLTGGQAHQASQAINQAAGVTPNVPKLPTGPKGKKPTVAGRGPAFVITQPKVTDTYKLDKAAKITPSEWAALSPGDKKLIRDELEAIEQRGFGPQQTKAKALLAQLPMNATLGNTSTPNAPAAPSTPGKVTLGQATKTIPKAPSAPAAPKAAAGPVTSADQAAAALRITEAIHGPQNASVQTVTDAFDKAKANGGKLEDHRNFKLLVDRLANNALRKADDAKMPGLGHGANDANITTFNHQIRDHIAEGKPGLPPIIQQLVDHKKGASKPSTPAAPKAFPPHVQHARAVAGRAAGGRPTAKLHLDAYGQLTKDEFDGLDSTTQKTIRDDLANARAKFLDPKKQQAAKDLLDRFGSRHPAPAAAPQAPAGHPKGYSDPQDQLVKAATSGLVNTDELLKATARLTPDQVNGLDDTDRKAVLGRLAFIATHPKATDEQKKQAAAYGRIINSGPQSTPPATPGQKPTLGELHRHEVSSGVAEKKAALDAVSMKTSFTPGSTPLDKAKALGALSKPHFDSLPADDQRKILDELQTLHRNRITNGGQIDVDGEVEKAFQKYTGIHPGLHRLRRAEADYKAGRITGDELHNHFLTARAQTPSSQSSAQRIELEKLAAKIARDNPSLPMYARVRLAGDQKYGLSTYDAISLAGMKHMWEPAPRLSDTDLRKLFQPTADDLKAVDPLHAEAIRQLQIHVLDTGLKGMAGTGSPWSDATRWAAASHLLGINSGGEISRDRLAAYKALPNSTQRLVREAVQVQLATRRDDHDKVDVWVAKRELEGAPPLQGAMRDAVLAATDRYSMSGKLDTYRALDPTDFQHLPTFARAAITRDLQELQARATVGGPTATWTTGDNPFKVFPAALTAHLLGVRQAPADRQVRAASDIVNYGRDIITPESRVATYNQLSPLQMDDLTPVTRKDLFDDLTKIENDSALPLQTRYDAAMNGQIFLKKPSAVQLTTAQQSAVQAADLHPNGRYNDVATMAAFSNLPKNEYDALSPAFRETIDERIKGLPGSDQQYLNGIFHPQAAAATPSGMAPTTAQANIPPHVQDALDTIYGVHPKSHTMAHQLSTYGALRGHDFAAFNPQEQQHLLSDLSFIATTAKGPSGDKARKLIDRFTPPGTPAGQIPTPAVIPPANAVPGQQRYATPLKGLFKAKNSGKSGDGWLTLPGGKRVWGHHGAAGLLVKHTDPNTGEERYLMVQRGPAISDPGKWTFPGGASDSLETPHEGATRETIEELGLKDDQFKDALVHGDHTFSVPGSTWKYTTVAASVPQMFQPNLTTAHARAETSDAKWMTIDEIRALDKSGKLHGPIAGGLLEKNVISLYPPSGASGAGKLGQIARPGPVTKRPNRMTMPSGGRQSPASFNAWPHAHKPSKGKNLVPDKAAIDAMRQQIKKDRALYDGKTADGRLAAIGAMQGFDDTPTVVSKSEIDRLLATGDYIEAWRGVSGVGGWSARSRGGSGGKTADEINEEMRSGPAYYGKGIFGNGYYLATKRSVAQQYADGTKGSIMRILIPKSALTQTYDKVEKEAQSNSSRLSKAKGSSGYELSTFWDPGRWAAAKGLDGIEINPHHRAHAGGGAGHVASPGKPAFNWLNRSVLVIQKEPG